MQSASSLLLAAVQHVETTHSLVRLTRALDDRQIGPEQADPRGWLYDIPGMAGTLLLLLLLLKMISEFATELVENMACMCHQDGAVGACVVTHGDGTLQVGPVSLEEDEGQGPAAQSRRRASCPGLSTL